LHPEAGTELVIISLLSVEDRRELVELAARQVAHARDLTRRRPQSDGSPKGVETLELGAEGGRQRLGPAGLEIE